MAEQGIRISLLENPLEGDNILVNASINNIDIVYNNAQSNISFSFTNNDALIISDPLHKVKIGSTKEESANNLETFLENNGYTSSDIAVVYSVFLNGAVWDVQGRFISNSIIFFDSQGNAGDRVVANSYNENPIPTTAPKYYFEYNNVIGQNWRCEIYQKGFTGTALEVNGRVSIIKGQATDHLTPIRGTGLDITLEASQSLPFTDLYTENESDFSVKLYKNTSLTYQGFLKPDGIFQSFSDTVWDLSVQAVDGLGTLSELAFVDNNGVPFFGKMNMLDIIYNCLKRTGLQLNMKTFVEVYYYGFVTSPDADILKKTYLNVERFKNQDDGSSMNCEQVLTSILTVLNAVVTQQDGEWYIYRPSDLYYYQNPLFRNYDINNNFTGRFQLDIKTKIGSDINNYGIIHCNRNQRIETKGALSAFRISYKYGLLSSLLDNYDLQHEAGTKIYEDWSVNTWTENRKNGYLVIDPVSKTGIQFISGVTFIGETQTFINALTSTSNPVIQKDSLVKFKTMISSYGYPASFRFEVRVGSYWLNWIDGSWQNTPLVFNVATAPTGGFPNSTGELVDQTFERTYSIDSQPIPVTGILEVRVSVPTKISNNLPAVKAEIKRIEVSNSGTGDNIVGEFHTVKRTSRVSTIVKDNKSVILGDNRNFVYLGAIYKDDQVSFTENWYRQQFAGGEVKPILRISAEDAIRLSQKPTLIFTGDIFGFVQYISRIEINNVNAVFMPISWNYDTYTNISQLKNLELYTPEVQDIEYAKTNDYGETTKPTIV